MTSTLKKLPPSTTQLLSSSQIITSISSVVKELIENSLDASATAIDIKLENCGFDKIEVQDNGTGIKPEDIPYVAQPHYTSKIHNFADLESLVTYGFRGEALGALCSVSDVNIRTKIDEEEISRIYTLDHNGKVVSSKPSPLGKGTTVIASKIFKNIPVRKQYYGSAKRRKEELKRVEDLLIAFASVQPGVRFALYHDHSLIWKKVAVSDVRSALVQVLGNNIINIMEYTSAKNDENEMAVEMFLPKAKSSASLSTRSTPDRFIVSINKRPVQIKEIEKLVLQYFNKSTDSNKRYPICYISLTCLPSYYDVNLEPNKTRVAFCDMEVVLALISSVLQSMYGSLEKEKNSMNDTNKTSSKPQISDKSDDFCDLPAKKNDDARRALQESQIVNISNCDEEKNIVSTESVHVNHGNCNIDILTSTRTEHAHHESSKRNRENFRTACNNLNKEVPEVSKEQNMFQKSDLANDIEIILDEKTSVNSNRFPSNELITTEKHKADNTENLEVSIGQNKTVDKGTARNSLEECEIVDVNVSNKNPDISLAHSLDINEIDVPDDDSLDNILCNIDNLGNVTKEQKKRQHDLLLNDDRNEITSEVIHDVTQKTESEANMHQKNIDNWSHGKLQGKNGTIIQPVQILSGKRHNLPQSESPEIKKRRLEEKHGQTTIYDMFGSQLVRRACTAFDYFCNEEKSEVIAQNPGVSNDDAKKLLVEQWDQLSNEKKNIYKELANKDAARVKKQFSRGEEKGSCLAKDKTTSKALNKNKKANQSYLNYKRHRHSYTVNFQIDDFKEKYSSFVQQYSQMVANDDYSLIGQMVPSGMWICCHNNQILGINHFRIQETVLFQRLQATHQLGMEKLDVPITLNESSLGSSLMWQTLFKLKTTQSSLNSFFSIVDERLTANGFDVRITEGYSGPQVAEITRISRCIPFYGLQDLCEILSLLAKEDLSIPLSQCRPLKVITYLQGEAVRMARQCPSRQQREDMEDIFKQMDMHIPQNSLQCFHKKPFFHVLYDLNNCSLTQSQ